jgi:hypothetical protein
MMARKPPKVKDPKEYAYAVEKGYAPQNIPPRPLFGNSLRDYTKTFTAKVVKARQVILAAWA